MQSFGTSKMVATVALTAGAAALAALGAAPAVAAPAQAAAPVMMAAAHGAPTYTGQVTSPIGLNIRAAAATDSTVVGALAYNHQFDIRCKVPAGLIDGNRLWYKLSDGSGWVSARYVANVGAAPRFCN